MESWWALVLWSLAGYLLVGSFISRFVYQQVEFEGFKRIPASGNRYYDYDSGYKYTSTKERNAGKAWWLSQTWGLWVTLGPPAAVLAGVGAAFFFTGVGVGKAVEWWIKSDSISVKPLVPHRPSLASAEEKLDSVTKELAGLQKDNAVRYEWDKGTGDE
jgi:hypothetical protein